MSNGDRRVPPLVAPKRSSFLASQRFTSGVRPGFSREIPPREAGNLSKPAEVPGSASGGAVRPPPKATTGKNVASDRMRMPLRVPTKKASGPVVSSRVDSGRISTFRPKEDAKENTAPCRSTGQFIASDQGTTSTHEQSTKRPAATSQTVNNSLLRVPIAAKPRPLASRPSTGSLAGTASTLHRPATTSKKPLPTAKDKSADFRAKAKRRASIGLPKAMSPSAKTLADRGLVRSIRSRFENLPAAEQPIRRRAAEVCVELPSSQDSDDSWTSDCSPVPVPSVARVAQREPLPANRVVALVPALKPAAHVQPPSPLGVMQPDVCTPQSAPSAASQNVATSQIGTSQDTVTTSQPKTTLYTREQLQNGPQLPGRQTTSGGPPLPHVSERSQEQVFQPNSIVGTGTAQEQTVATEVRHATVPSDQATQAKMVHAPYLRNSPSPWQTQPDSPLETSSPILSHLAPSRQPIIHSEPSSSQDTISTVPSSRQPLAPLSSPSAFQEKPLPMAPTLPSLSHTPPVRVSAENGRTTGILGLAGFLDSPAESDTSGIIPASLLIPANKLMSSTPVHSPAPLQENVSFDKSRIDVSSPDASSVASESPHSVPISNLHPATTNSNLQLSSTETTQVSCNSDLSDSQLDREIRRLEAAQHRPSESVDESLSSSIPGVPLDESMTEPYFNDSVDESTPLSEASLSACGPGTAQDTMNPTSPSFQQSLRETSSNGSQILVPAHSNSSTEQPHHYSLSQSASPSEIEIVEHISTSAEKKTTDDSELADVVGRLDLNNHAGNSETQIFSDTGDITAEQTADNMVSDENFSMQSKEDIDIASVELVGNSDTHENLDYSSVELLEISEDSECPTSVSEAISEATAVNNPTASKQQGFYCDVCDQVLKTEYSLQRHFGSARHVKAVSVANNKVHEKEENDEEEGCEKADLQVDELSQDFLTMSVSYDSNYCPVCDETFKSHNGLVAHERRSKKHLKAVEAARAARVDDIAEPQANVIDPKRKSPLDVLLQVCGQTEPAQWDAVFDTVTMKTVFKLGEGTFAEVFGTHDDKNQLWAYKIMPIDGEKLVNGDAQKTSAELMSEVTATSALSKLSAVKDASGGDPLYTTSNFIRCEWIRICKGVYPSGLLAEWDKWDKQQESENERPDIFDDEQLFIIFRFCNGGTDLELIEFDTVQEAASMLRQVCFALAVAEEALNFEHRDLHWGNVLIKPTDDSFVDAVLDGRKARIDTSNIHASIIDFTLSRLQDNDKPLFLDLETDQDYFTGEGDPQFDCYRKMRKALRRDWSSYNPKTNVIWLQYLANKLCTDKDYNESPTLTTDVAEIKKFANRISRRASAKSCLSDRFIQSGITWDP